MEPILGTISTAILISINIAYCWIGGRRLRLLEQRIQMLEERPLPQMPIYTNPQYTYTYPQPSAPYYSQDPQGISRV